MKIITEFKVRVKSTKIMGEYIALHGRVPNSELPEHLRWKIPEDEIWIRRNVYDDKRRRNKILGHEDCELTLMINEDLTYKQAHAKATRMEETGDLSICKY